MAGEKELVGLDPITCNCNTVLPLQVCRSGAGYYLGHYCPRCGPYSRETGYFSKREIAIDELKKKIPNKLRNTKHLS